MHKTLTEGHSVVDIVSRSMQGHRTRVHGVEAEDGEGVADPAGLSAVAEADPRARQQLVFAPAAACASDPGGYADISGPLHDGKGITAGILCVA